MVRCASAVFRQALALISVLGKSFPACMQASVLASSFSDGKVGVNALSLSSVIIGK